MSNNLLKGKKGVIFGALNEQSMAWKIAKNAVQQGAEVILSNTAISIRMGNIEELAEKLNTIVIAADATNTEDIEALYTKSIEHFGGKFDFILHSIGMSPNVRKKLPYDELNYNYMMKTI
ncbi:MAG: SDR family oxidoreductase, partial [Bacteroidota bacterium]|nr:SDR family oxidoreductase [Bacteroidota bacterium]